MLLQNMNLNKSFMKKIVILLGFLFVTSISLFAQATLTWKFTNPELITGTSDEYKFDVEIKSSTTTTIVGSLLKFTFDATSFSSSPEVSITPGTSFSSFFPSGPTVSTNDISYQLNSLSGGVSIDDNFVVFCSVTIEVVDLCGDAGINFNTSSMNGQSFYNPFTAYINAYDNDLDGSIGYTPSTSTWTGAEDSDWDNPANWTDCVPGATSAAIIPDVTVVKALAPIANVNVEVNDLTIQPNGSLTVPSPHTLTVNNELLIESDASGTGSLIHNTSGVAGELQRHLKGWGSYSTELKNGHGWHLLSSPVAAQSIAPFQDLTDNDDFLKWSEVDNVWKNRRQGGGSTVPDPDFDAEFGVGDGYLVAYEDDTTFTFEGAINIAGVSVTGLTNTGTGNYYGFNMLGNPYASALEWDNGNWGLTSVSSNIQIWHEANASYEVIGSNGIIPAMQGFFVYTTGNGSLTIPASARVHSSQAYYKSETEQILLTARDLNHEMLQESKIRFNENATEGFDLQYDAYYMAGYAPRFYSLSNNEAFALNTYPELNEDLTIPFQFIKNHGTEFSITLEESIEGAPVYLVDLKTNLTVDLTTGAYFFTSEEGDDPNRFLIKFGTVGIDDLVKEEETKIRIFSHDHTIFLNSEAPMGKAQVGVFDLLGRQVLSQEVMINNSASIMVSGLSGTYIVRAVANGETVSTKLYFR
jgi:hypothetical protein